MLASVALFFGSFSRWISSRSSKSRFSLLSTRKSRTMSSSTRDHLLSNPELRHDELALRIDCREPHRSSPIVLHQGAMLPKGPVNRKQEIRDVSYFFPAQSLNRKMSNSRARSFPCACAPSCHHFIHRHSSVCLDFHL